MYDPDTYRRFKAPDNVIPPSIHLVVYELYTLMFQLAVLIVLVAVQLSEDWLYTKAYDLSESSNMGKQCMDGKALDEFQDSQDRFIQALDSKKTKWMQEKKRMPNQDEDIDHDYTWVINNSNLTYFTQTSTYLPASGKDGGGGNSSDDNPDFFELPWVKMLVDPTFDRVQIGLHYGCMQSMKSELELGIELPKFYNRFNPLLLFIDNFTDTEFEQERKAYTPQYYMPSDATLNFIMHLFPGSSSSNWTLCSKCFPLDSGMYGAMKGVLFWMQPILGVSILFLLVSAISATLTHDSHALPKITAFLGSFIQIVTTLILVTAMVMMMVIQMDCNSVWLPSMSLTFVVTIVSFIPSILILVVVLRYRNITYEGM